MKCIADIGYLISAGGMVVGGPLVAIDLLKVQRKKALTWSDSLLPFIKGMIWGKSLAVTESSPNQKECTI